MNPHIKYALAIALVAVMLLAVLSGCTSVTPTGTTNPSSSTCLPGDTTGSGTESTPGSTETTGGTEPTGTTAPTTESTTPIECQHNYGEWTVKKDADCTTQGEKNRACTKCGVTQSEAIAELGHSYGS